MFKRKSDKEPASFIHSVWMVIIGFILLCSIPFYIFHYDKVHLLDNYKNQLTQLTEQKTNQIDNWFNQKYGNAALLQKNPIFEEYIKSNAKVRTSYEDGLASVFTQLERNMGYDALTIINRHGERLYSIGQPTYITDLFKKIYTYDETVLLWFIEQNDLYLNVVIPIRDQSSYFIQGYIVLNQSVKSNLLPNVQSWTDNTSQTGYTTLLHIDGPRLITVKIKHGITLSDEIKIQNIPPNDTDILRIATSLNDGTQLINVGQSKIMISHQPLGFSEWYILLQKDVNEIIAPAYQDLYLLLTILAVTALAILLFLYQHSRQSKYRYSIQLERKTAEKDRLLKHFFELPLFGMGITHTQTGRWIRLNNYLSQLLGYPLDEIQKISFFELIQTEQRDTLNELIQRMESGETDGFQHEFRMIHKSGQLVDVNIDSRCVRTDDRISFFINVIEDITEKKLNERALNKKTNLYNMLSRTNQAIVHSKTQNELFNKICTTIVEDGGFSIALMAKCIEDYTNVDILNLYGDNNNFIVDFANEKTKDKAFVSQTGIIQAVLQQRELIINNYQRESFTRPFHKLAQYANINSAAYFPIFRDSLMYGVLAVYSEEVDFFDKNTADTLHEMAGDISFSLDNMKRDLLLMKSERLFHNMTNFVKVGIFRLTASGHMNYINEFGQQLLQLQLPEQSTNWMDVFDGDSELRHSWLFSLLKNGESKMECQIVREQTTNTLIVHAIAEIENDSVVGYIGTISDITDIRNSEQQLKYLAHYDQLTGLPNRNSLTQTLEARMSEQPDHEMALLLVDLDRFKDVNDSFGHPMGNILLKDVADRLIQNIPEMEYISRLGGDEFTILIKNVSSLLFINEIATETIQLLKQPFHLPNGQDVILGASIGISRYPINGKTAAELLQKADTAMYHAKQHGRNCFRYFTDELSQVAQQRLDMEIRLKNAVEQQHLRTFFQPQVDMVSGQIIGAEALIRWHDPVEGFIPPFRFIPLAEETGLINMIGDWILKDTCRQGKIWLDSGLPPITLAVNISPVQFRYNNLLATIEQTLKETQFPPYLLELEITEGVLMSHEQGSIEILNKLRKLGVRVAMDDFGTGYSSLSYLKKIPLDVLKIDKSFVDDIPDKKDDMEIATAIIGMAHTLRLKVLAEGVETIHQFDFLRKQGCDYYQGYLMSKPVAADQFEQLWRRHLGTQKQVKLV